jgi:D-3-phosphoglycerate dehydrogenase
MRVLITDKVANEAIAQLKENFEVHLEELDNETILSIIENYDAIIVGSRTKVTKEIIDKGRNLRVIGKAGIDVENIDVQFATQNGIPVVYAPTGSTFSMAELTIAQMLALARMIPRADRSMKVGKWEKKHFTGTELRGKTLGQVGSDRIGIEVARLAQAFGMITISCNPYIPERLLKKAGIKCVGLEECLNLSDFVTVHSLLSDETRGMIAVPQLKKMKKTAFIINCSWGGVIEEEALYKALTEGWIAGAALDVYVDEPPKNKKLIGLDNVISTPHIGASTLDAQIKYGIIIGEQVTRVLKGELPVFIVNREVYG